MSETGSRTVDETAIREYIRATHKCVPPHGSLDDLLDGDCTLLEVRERQAALQPAEASDD